MNEQPKVLLCTLSVRKSQRTGKSYLSGYLGRSRLIGFQSAEPDRWGRIVPPWPGSPSLGSAA